MGIGFYESGKFFVFAKKNYVTFIHMLLRILDIGHCVHLLKQVSCKVV